MDRNTTLNEIMKSPIGKDVIDQITDQLGVDSKFLSYPFIRKTKLGSLQKLLKLDDDIVDTLLKLIESETESPYPSTKRIKRAKFKEDVYYQIYPKSLGL